MVTDFDVVVYMLAMMVLSGAVGWFSYQVCQYIDRVWDWYASRK